MFSTTALSVFFLLGHNAGCLRPLLKGFANRRTFSGLRRDLKLCPQGSRSSNPGLKLPNAFGVFQDEPLLFFVTLLTRLN